MLVKYLTVLYADSCNKYSNSVPSLQVLLLVDASYGFEMEAFEFLNILQVHGFPKVMGVLTHLDLIKSAKAQRKTKKRLKQRFWTEIYQVMDTENECGVPTTGVTTDYIELSWK